LLVHGLSEQRREAEGKDRIEHIIELLDQARLGGLAADAAAAGLHDELTDLLNRLPARLRGHFVDARVS
jgi:hypothetical protein